MVKMEELKVYQVTKSSSDKTFIKGDIIWLSLNGDLNSCNGKGWLPKKEQCNPKTNDFEVELNKEYFLDTTNGHETIKKIIQK